MNAKRIGRWDKVLDDVEEIIDGDPTFLDFSWKRSLAVQWLFAMFEGVPIPEAEARLQFLRGEGVPCFFTKKSEHGLFWATMDYVAECMLAYFLENIDLLEGLLSNWESETKAFDYPDERVWLNAIAGRMAIPTTFGTKSFHWLESAYIIAESKEWRFLQVSLAEGLAELCTSRNNYQQAGDWLSLAILTCEELETDRPMARLLDALGSLSLRRQDPEAASKFFFEAYDALENLPDDDATHRLRSRVLVNLGASHFALDEPETALVYFTRAEEAVDQSSITLVERTELDAMTVAILLEAGRISEAKQRVENLVSDPVNAQFESYQFQKHYLQGLVHAYDDNLGEASTSILSSLGELTGKPDWQLKLKAGSMAAFISLRKAISAADVDELLSLSIFLEELKQTAERLELTNTQMQLAMILSRIAHLAGDPTKAAEHEAEVKDTLGETLEGVLATRVLPASWKTNPAPSSKSTMRLLDELVRMLKVIAYRQSPRIVLGGHDEETLTGLEVDFALFSMDDMGPVCMAHTLDPARAMNGRTDGERNEQGEPGSVHATDTAHLEGVLAQLAIHLTVVLGQGVSYHQGFYGPFPTGFGDNVELVAYAFVRPSPHSTDERIARTSYSILAMFYETESDIYRRHSRNDLRTKLKEEVAVEWMELTDFDQWIKDVKKSMQEFL